MIRGEYPLFKQLKRSRGPIASTVVAEVRNCVEVTTENQWWLLVFGKSYLETKLVDGV